MLNLMLGQYGKITLVYRSMFIIASNIINRKDCVVGLIQGGTDVRRELFKITL